ncbi:MAG: hypothetical protein LBV20_02825 [Treponema sp.]|nr:hypothetical protein [Treponema sp.]
MKNLKKIALGMAVLCCITAVLFTSCNKKEEAPLEGEYPIELTVFTGQSRPQPSADNPAYQYLKDTLNVTFKWDILVGDIAQKRGIMIAGGDYPDIIEINETAFIEAGAVIPLEGLIEEHAPSIRTFFGNDWDKIKSADGHVYYLPNFGIMKGRDQNPVWMGSSMWIQKEVLKDAGYPKVVTLDQYFDLITAYAKKNPMINGQSVIPFTVLTDDWRAFCLWNPPNFISGNSNDGNGVVNPETFEYKTFFTMDTSKRWFKKLNELNSQGLIDRSGFTDNYDQYIAKISAGRVLGIHDQYWQFQNADFALRDAGQYNRTMAPIPVVFDESIRPHYRDIPIPNLGRGFGISVSAKDPVRIIKMLEKLLSEEVQRNIEWGIECQHWQYDADGIPYRTPEQRANWDNLTWQEQNRPLLIRDIFPKWEGSFTDGYPTDLVNFYLEREAMLRDEDKELWEAYGVTSMAEMLDKDPPPNDPWYPTWTMPNPPDGSPAQIALQRCEQTMKRMLPQIILASPAEFEGLWASYVDEMNANELSVYEAYMQEQLDRRLKEWGLE